MFTQTALCPGCFFISSARYVALLACASTFTSIEVDNLCHILGNSLKSFLSYCVYECEDNVCVAMAAARPVARNNTC